MEERQAQARQPPPRRKPARTADDIIIGADATVIIMRCQNTPRSPRSSRTEESDMFPTALVTATEPWRKDVAQQERGGRRGESSSVRYYYWL